MSGMADEGRSAEHAEVMVAPFDVPVMMVGAE